MVSEGPQSHYARSADGTHLAYHVSGEGPNTLVVLGSGSPVPIDLLRDDPDFQPLDPTTEPVLSSRVV